jgi:hypothetical protein
MNNLDPSLWAQWYTDAFEILELQNDPNSDYNKDFK